MEKSITFRNVDSIKNKLVDTVLIVGTSIAFTKFIVTLFPLTTEIINFDFYLDILSLGSLYLTYFFRNKLSFIFKSNIIIAMLFMIVISDVFENGLDSPNTVIVVLIPFLSILIYNFRISISLYLAAISVFLIIGILFQNGMIASTNYNAIDHTFRHWVEVALVLSVVTVVITLFVHQFNSTIYKLIENLQSQKDDLADRESLLSIITKNIPRTTLTVIDRNLIIQYTDGSQYLNWDLDPSQFIGTNAIDSLQPFGDDGVQKMKIAYQKCFEGDLQTVQMNYGDDILLFKVIPLASLNGQISSLLIVSENITEHVKNQLLIDENLNEKNVLLQEIHHRVKNNLAVVSGLLSLQSFKIEDPKSKFILEKSTNRIMSIAKVHEMLYESKNFNRIRFDRYINELSTIILDSMNQDGKTIAFNTDINVGSISINHGVPLGIIFNELITNSVKYGFEKNMENIISIKVDQIDKRFHVVYEDNGSGIEDFEEASAKSLGFTLIESLMHQIDAEYEYETQNRFKLSFHFDDDSSINPYQIME